MSRGTLSVLSSLTLLSLAGLNFEAGAADKTASKEEKTPYYPHLHRALHDLHGAHKELKEATIDFGGNKEKAIKSVDSAIKSIEKALKGAKLKELPKSEHKKVDHYPHMHHALHALKGAEKELKEAKDNMGGHKEAVERHVEAAAKDIEACLKHARENKTTSDKKSASK
jgi:hypothetical protein